MVFFDTATPPRAEQEGRDLGSLISKYTERAKHYKAQSIEFVVECEWSSAAEALAISNVFTSIVEDITKLNHPTHDGAEEKDVRDVIALPADAKFADTPQEAMSAEAFYKQKTNNHYKEGGYALNDISAKKYFITWMYEYANHVATHRLAAKDREKNGDPNCSHEWKFEAFDKMGYPIEKYCDLCGRTEDAD